MAYPRLMIASTEIGIAEEIALSIGAKKLSTHDCFEYYIWDIQNKYYKAKILVCVAPVPCTDFSIDGVEALIVYHNPQAADADEKLKALLPLINALSKAEILVFTCNFIANVALRNKVISWCQKRKFELVELNRPDNDIAESDLDHNKYGIERIIEALHAHMWPNMILRGKNADEEEASELNGVNEQLENIKLTQDPSERLPMENVLDGLMGEENTDFGELFSHLMAMKEYAATLPTSQRRRAAEQLVTAFWKAMGGDPTELLIM